MGIFDKKKTPSGKTVPLGPPNLDKMEDASEAELPRISRSARDEGLEGLKGEVGFPEESNEGIVGDFPEQTEQEEQQYGGFEEPEAAESEPTNEAAEEPLAPQPTEYPDFLPPPPGLPIEPPAGSSSAEELKQALRDIVNEIRTDFDEKIAVVNQELEQIKIIENSIEILTDDIEKLNKKYDELAQKLSSSKTDEIVQMQNTVNEINQIMKTALPALIREVRDIKTSKYLA